jgi:Putative transposase
MTHHPHVHMIVPGGGISLDGKRWVACRPSYLLPVDVLSPLFRGRFLQKLLAAHREGSLTFFGKHARLAERKAFAAYLRPSRKVTQGQVARLLQATIRRTRGRARLSVALYPPRRHLQPPADRQRPPRRHLQVQGRQVLGQT